MVVPILVTSQAPTPTAFQQDSDKKRQMRNVFNLLWISYS